METQAQERLALCKIKGSLSFPHRLHILLARSDHLLLVVTSFLWKAQERLRSFFKAIHLAWRLSFLSALKMWQITSAVVKDGLKSMLMFVVLKERVLQMWWCYRATVFSKHFRIASVAWRESIWFNVSASYLAHLLCMLGYLCRWHK